MLDWDDDKIVGVIGGLGPLATAYFLEAVVDLTDAASDQEHVNLLVTQHSATPDRTRHILDQRQPDPGPVMAADARFLERSGAGALVLPCNTAHHFVESIHAAISVPLLDIVEQAVAEVGRREPAGAVCAILATDGTLSAEVYQKALERAGHRYVIPSDQDQRQIMEIIYDQVKAGNPIDFELFDAILGRVRALGANQILLGCTELSVVAKDAEILDEPDIVDSLYALARATVEWTGKSAR